jgi:lysophosphatidylcholine acyltransferase/lyso-PAF acetyltransferase
LIEETGEYPPFFVFAEGGTSNGRYLLPFKRGAFTGSRAVKPIVLRYSYGTLSPAYDILPFVALFFMNICILCETKCEVLELPTFVPNEYLYKTHQNKVDA